jgi:hypothetical protein
VTSILYLDTACAAFPSNAKDGPRWEPHCVRIAAIREDDGVETGRLVTLIAPRNDWQMSEAAKPYHRATADDFLAGEVVRAVALDLVSMMQGIKTIVSHNMQFHRKMVGALMADGGLVDPFNGCEWFCTMTESAPICQIRLMSAGRWKSPTLAEAHMFFTGVQLQQQIFGDHPTPTWKAFAESQVEAVRRVYQGIQDHDPDMAAIEARS